MLTGTIRIRYVKKLLRIRSRSHKVRKQASGRDHDQKEDGRDAKGLHASPARIGCATSSAAELARSVINVTIMVRFTSSSRSRLSAAFHASCPIPGRSHRTSTGIAAANAIQSEEHTSELQ